MDVKYVTAIGRFIAHAAVRLSMHTIDPRKIETVHSVTDDSQGEFGDQVRVRVVKAADRRFVELVHYGTGDDLSAAFAFESGQAHRIAHLIRRGDSPAFIDQVVPVRDHALDLADDLESAARFIGERQLDEYVDRESGGIDSMAEGAAFAFKLTNRLFGALFDVERKTDDDPFEYGRFRNVDDEVKHRIRSKIKGVIEGGESASTRIEDTGPFDSVKVSLTAERTLGVEVWLPADATQCGQIAATRLEEVVPDRDFYYVTLVSAVASAIGVSANDLQKRAVEEFTCTELEGGEAAFAVEIELDGRLDETSG